MRVVMMSEEQRTRGRATHRVKWGDRHGLFEQALLGYGAQRERSLQRAGERGGCIVHFTVLHVDLGASHLRGHHGRSSMNGRRCTVVGGRRWSVRSGLLGASVAGFGRGATPSNLPNISRECHSAYSIQLYSGSEDASFRKSSRIHKAPRPAGDPLAQPAGTRPRLEIQKNRSRYASWTSHAWTRNRPRLCILAQL